jgi:hypothetical protein
MSAASSVSTRDLYHAYEGRNLYLYERTAFDLDPFDFVAAGGLDKVPFETNVIPWLIDAEGRKKRNVKPSTKVKKCAGCQTEMNRDHYSRRQWEKPGGRCDSCVDSPAKRQGHK